MRITILACFLSFVALGCDSAEDDTPRTFSVTIENVSTPNTVATDRAMGTVPLSPGPWAVFSGSDSMLTVGALANLGTEWIAEDGFADEMIAPSPPPPPSLRPAWRPRPAART